MSHRNLKDLKNLDSSLKKLSENSKSKHNFLVGDFDWPTSIGKHLQFVRPRLTAKYSRHSLIFQSKMDFPKYEGHLKST